MLEIGRNFWTPPGPTELLKQGTLQHIAQDHVQAAFEYLQEWRLHHLSGQPVLSHPHSRKVFADLHIELPVFQFVPLILSLGITEKSLAPSSLHPPFRSL